MEKSNHPLRLWRIHKQMTLDELSTLVNVSKPSLSKIENGHIEPTLKTAIKISKKTKIPVEDFAL